MKYQIYSVRDEAVESFGVPFFSATEAGATRSFRMVCNDPSSTVHHCPGDFALYHIGEFDDENGLFNPIHPALVIRGSSFKESCDA